MPKITDLPIQTNAGINAGDSIPIVDSFTQETKQIPMGQLDLRYAGVPDGGLSQQVLAKNSGTNKDVYWKTLDKNSVGLGNVDNTSDINKPISTATQTALNLKANTSALASKADTTALTAGLATKQDKLPTGTDGYVLTLVSGLPAWTPGGGGGGAVSSVFGRIGNVVAQTGDYDKSMIGLDQVDNTSDMDKPISTATAAALAAKQASLPGGVNGQVLSLAGGVPVWVNATPLTTKGDIFTRDGSGVARLAVGANDKILTADSTAATGLAWKDAPISLPVQTGNSGKWLTTNGTAASWGDLLSAVATVQSLANAATMTLPAGLIKMVKVVGSAYPCTVSLPAGTVMGEQLFVEGTSDAFPVNVANLFEVYTDQVGHAVWNGTAWLKVGGV